jgi:hypothetical protein
MTDTSIDEAAVETVAKIIWADFFARMGGAWPGMDSQLVAVIQCIATARAALSAIASRQAVPLLGSEDDTESLAYALRIANMAEPARDYQGALYIAHNSDGYRDAEFRDYGLARAVRVIINHAARINSALTAPVRDETELREAAQAVYDKLASETGTVTILDQERLGEALRALSQTSKPEDGSDDNISHVTFPDEGREGRR